MLVFKQKTEELYTFPITKILLQKYELGLSWDGKKNIVIIREHRGEDDSSLFCLAFQDVINASIYIY